MKNAKHVQCNGPRPKELDTMNRVQILGEAVCISYSINTVGRYALNYSLSSYG